MEKQSKHYRKHAEAFSGPPAFLAYIRVSASYCLCLQFHCLFVLKKENTPKEGLDPSLRPRAWAGAGAGAGERKAAKQEAHMEVSAGFWPQRPELHPAPSLSPFFADGERQGYQWKTQRRTAPPPNPTFIPPKPPRVPFPLNQL